MTVKAYELITNKIIEQLKVGVIPWHKPWKCNSSPKNLISKKPYIGVNRFLLGMNPFSSSYYVTYKQAKELDGSVRKGEKGSIVIFVKPIGGRDKTEEEIKLEEEGFISEDSRRLMVKHYYLFNVEQCDGLESKVPAEKTPEIIINLIKKAEAIAEGYKNRPPVNFGGDRAYYSPSADRIQMPPKKTFGEQEKYYSVLFHEMIHSTGHKKRLDRNGFKTFDEVDSHYFGSQDYSKEELVAELGASFLCYEAGIVNETINNSAAYIQSWLKKLENDNKMIIQAASFADKASSYILNKNN